MNLSRLVKNICHKKENKTIILNHLKKYPKEEACDLLYELSFMKQEGKELPEIFNHLKESKLGFQHPDFVEIIKKVKETDSFMLTPFDAEEGVNQCKKCKSKRTISYAKQTRALDEGTTCFVFCIECKHRYMMNS